MYIFYEINETQQLFPNLCSFTFTFNTLSTLLVNKREGEQQQRHMYASVPPPDP
jgi:hypothetical protein